MKKAAAVILALVLLFSFTAVRPAAAEEAEKIEQNGFVCERLRDGNLKLVSYKNDAAGKTVNIPSTINGSHVTRIGGFAFNGCKMVNVTIPDTVKMMEAFAFNDCTEIQKVSIPNEVYFIDGNPFTGCRNLVNISLDPRHPTLRTTSDGVLYSKRNKMLLCYPCSKEDRSYSVMEGTISIGENAFYGCGKLESISIPNTVKALGDGAFLGCVRLANVSLPDSLLTIGELAFAGCSLLNGVTIPRNVSRIEKSTFFRCESLVNVSFPKNLSVICENAFFGCSKLQEIHLPENLTTIGDMAFNSCKSLTDAYIPVSVTDIGDAAFDNCSVRLRMHLDEYSFAEIYSLLYDITFTYGNEDSFLTDNTDQNTGDE